MWHSVFSDYTFIKLRPWIVKRAVFLTIKLFFPYLRISRSWDWHKVEKDIRDPWFPFSLPSAEGNLRSNIWCSVSVTVLLFPLPVSSTPQPRTLHSVLSFFHRFWLSFFCCPTKATARIHEYAYWNYITSHLINVNQGCLSVCETNGIAQSSKQLTTD